VRVPKEKDSIVFARRRLTTPMPTIATAYARKKIQE
jgi:hypothetical protein